MEEGLSCGEVPSESFLKAWLHNGSARLSKAYKTVAAKEEQNRHSRGSDIGDLGSSPVRAEKFLYYFVNTLDIQLRKQEDQIL